MTSIATVKCQYCKDKVRLKLCIGNLASGFMCPACFSIWYLHQYRRLLDINITIGFGCRRCGLDRKDHADPAVDHKYTPKKTFE